MENFTPRHAEAPWAILTKIGIGDNVVDITRHAKFYRAPFRDFCSQYNVIFNTTWVTSF